MSFGIFRDLVEEVFSERKKTKYVERFGCRCILGKQKELGVLDVCLAIEDED